VEAKREHVERNFTGVQVSERGVGLAVRVILDDNVLARGNEIMNLARTPTGH
jgi:hypothetical protein